MSNTNTATVSLFISARFAKKLMSKYGKVDGKSVFFGLYGNTDALQAAFRLAETTSMKNLIEGQVNAIKGL